MQSIFLTSLARHMGVDPTKIEQPGVTVAPDPERAASQVTAGYLLGQHFVITCDPAVEERLVQASRSMAPTMDAWCEVAASNGGALLGGARMQLLPPGSLPTAAVPDGYSLRELHREDPRDIALVERLIEVSDEDDLEMAEIEIDNLDEIIAVVLDGDGDIVTFSSACPFDMAEAFGDIGILTRPESRGTGLAKAAVSALCPRVLDAGLEPLWRCDETNTGSVELSRSLGFSPATQLTAFRFDHQE